MLPITPNVDIILPKIFLVSNPSEPPLFNSSPSLFHPPPPPCPPPPSPLPHLHPPLLQNDRRSPIPNPLRRNCPPFPPFAPPTPLNPPALLICFAKNIYMYVALLVARRSAFSHRGRGDDILFST